MREPKEEKMDKLKAELVRAREKANRWQARIRDLERQITEQENLAILRAVRSVAASPEELRGLLKRIQEAGSQEVSSGPPHESPCETLSADGAEKEEQQWRETT